VKASTSDRRVISVLQGACVGAALGAIWGVFLRVWMRLLVVYGEFTWAGTLAIIGFAAAAGAGLGLVRAARLSGGSRRWRWAGLLAAPLVLFPQGILFLLPALLLGGLALSGRPRLWLRITLVALTLTPTVLAPLLEPAPMAMPYPIIWVTLVTLLTLLAAAGAELFRPWPSDESIGAGPAEAPIVQSIP